MKRISVLFMTLILSISLFAFPASADEVFVFENSNGINFIFNDLIPSGMYEFKLFVEGDDSVYFLSDPVYIGSPDGNFDEDLGSSFYGAECSVLKKTNGNISEYLSSCFVQVYVFESRIMLMFATEDGDPFDFGPGAEIHVSLPRSDVPVSGDSLSGIVSSDLLSGVMDNIISLLPAVLVLIVAYIAIRKGISFIRDLLHAA